MKIKEISKGQFNELVIKQFEAIQETRKERNRILGRETSQAEEKIHSKIDYENAMKIVLHKLSDVCMLCKEFKPFANMKECCESCDNYWSEWWDLHNKNCAKGNKERLGKLLNLSFKHGHKEQGRPHVKERRIKFMGVDI